MNFCTVYAAYVVQGVKGVKGFKGDKGIKGIMGDMVCCVCIKPERLWFTCIAYRNTKMSKVFYLHVLRNCYICK